MSKDELTGTPNRAFWVISCIALVWNLIGVGIYIMTIAISAETLEAMSASERSLYEGPIVITIAYTLAVLTGLVACVFLIMRRAVAIPLFVVSLISILIQMGYALLLSPLLEVQGMAASILPLVIIIVGALLIWFSTHSKSKGWLH